MSKWEGLSDEERNSRFQALNAAFTNGIRAQAYGGPRDLYGEEALDKACHLGAEFYTSAVRRYSSSEDEATDILDMLEILLEKETGMV